MDKTDELNVCPCCGLKYDKFRTGLNFSAVRDLFWVDTPDQTKWRYKRRNSVLGKWHEIKKKLWSEHLDQCSPNELEDIILEPIDKY